MPRLIIVAQDKGGSGKSLMSRALAEAVPDAPIIEIESEHRLMELGSVRVTHCPMRASHEDIQRSGGRASRSEFDLAIDAMAAATLPTIVDVGANTAKYLFPVLAGLTDDLTEADITIGVLFVVTSEAPAIANIASLAPPAKRFAAAQFLVENRFHKPVDREELAGLVGKAKLSVLERVDLVEEAVAIYAAGGLACVPQLDGSALKAEHGFMKGARVRSDLTELRLKAMQAVEPAATWLVS
ncbi:MAG: hypothetical protein ACFE0R_09260 [Salinarimonas sp.]